MKLSKLFKKEINKLDSLNLVGNSRAVEFFPLLTILRFAIKTNTYFNEITFYTEIDLILELWWCCSTNFS